MKPRFVKPKKLQKGDTIAIVSPSSPASLSPELTKNGIKFLEDKGFKVLDRTQKKLERNPKLKAAIINNLFKDDSVAAIMAFWGGFTSNEVLDYLDFTIIKKHPKIFIGYSDITAITSAITSKTGLVTFSGPGLISFIKPQPFDYTWQFFKKACLESAPFEITPSKNYADDQYFLRKDSDHRIIKKNQGWKIFSQGKTNGYVVVGNLQTILVLVGTKYFPTFKNVILFIEEDETVTPELLTRFMVQLKQLGILSQIKGLVLGRFCEQTGVTFIKLERILKSVLGSKSIPIVYNLDFGHSDPIITVPNGGQCQIDTQKKLIKFGGAVL